MLELKGIHKYYNPGTVNEMCLFQDFDLTIDKGEFVSVVGSNGSGKTSMLNIICGSIPVEGGQILINGSDITKQKEYKRNQRIGRVYQNPAMGTCPTMTILENMSLADNKGKVFGLSRGTNKARMDYYREQLSQLGLGLEDKMDVKVGALSGGQRQAMALLMSTMTPIEFLILDEHTAALDPKTAELIMELTDKIVKEKNLTTIMVTHNLRYAIEYGNRLGSNGSGKTSMLNIICGSIPVEGGQILINGSDITKQKEYKRNQRIGRVYQNPAMGTCPTMTILENMSLADNKGKVFGLSRGTNKARMDYYREQLSQLGLGLEDKMDVKVGALSGGQRQAMALLMSTMTPIEFLILDEHTAALDPKTAELIMELTDKIVKEKNLTTIMVTHNLRYAIEYGNRLVMMHQGNTILDKKGEEKDRMSVDDILALFNEISIECGN